MLERANIAPESIFHLFAPFDVDVGFLVPTETGYKKSIMDATAPIRNLLLEAGYHNYETQSQGPQHKRVMEARIVLDEGEIKTTASLYRPNTKMGDPRIWISNLKRYSKPYDLLALVATTDILYVFNMSNPEMKYSLTEGTGYQILKAVEKGHQSIVDELLSKLRIIRAKGFIPAHIIGDTAVGMTLEKQLGIEPNASRLPDYRGIELKSGRSNTNKNRSTLFSQTPDWKGSNTTRDQILDDWGYLALDKAGIQRTNLYCTVEAHRPNTQGLFFEINTEQDALINWGYKSPSLNKLFVAKWNLSTLRSNLANKHRETFWVAATSKREQGQEFFRYESVLYTREPRVSLLPYLIDTRVVTMDYIMHRYENSAVRDHGFPFKIPKSKLSLLFPEPVEYDLS